MKPLSAARWRGVISKAAFAFGSAPWSSKNWTISGLSAPAASCNGVPLICIKNLDDFI